MQDVETRPVTRANPDAATRVVRDYDSLYESTVAGDWAGVGRSAIEILVVILLGWALYRILRRVLDTLDQRRRIPSIVAVWITSVLRWVIIAIVALLVLQAVIDFDLSTLWPSVAAVLALIGAGFIAFWSVLSSTMCTILLLIFRPFEIGDEIELLEPTGTKGLRGKVVYLNFMFTTLEEAGDGGRSCRVLVPNNVIFQKSIRRWPGARTERLDDHLMKSPEQREAEAPA